MATSAVPESFRRKKSVILASLSVPATAYSDKSPKGSIDESIKDLINEINGYEGLVTTSSCAGRISVFLEGIGTEVLPGQSAIGSTVDSDYDLPTTVERAVPGGKGGGEFLFTSHDPMRLHASSPSLMHTFKLTPMAPNGEGGDISQHYKDNTRMVRFSFEPMILHVMAASLKHARPLLAAAINAGFRESGVQSLRNIDDPEACPMVAVRTAGLGVESIIGHMRSTSAVNGNHQGSTSHRSDDSRLEALVTEEYLVMLVQIANERFSSNAKRIKRFASCLRDAIASEQKKCEKAQAWEDPEARRQRKRAEGLRTQAERMTAQTRRSVQVTDDDK